MTWKCCVWNCRSSLSTRGKRFFRFPIPNDGLSGLKTRRFEAWRKALGYGDGFVPFNKCVCNLHFVTGNPAHLTDVSNRDWIPSLKLRKESFDEEGSKLNHRHQKNKRRKKSSSDSPSLNRSSDGSRKRQKQARPSSHGSQTSFSSDSDSRSDGSYQSSGGGRTHRKESRRSRHGSQTSFSSASDSRSEGSNRSPHREHPKETKQSSNISVPQNLLSPRGSECQQNSSFGSSSSSAACRSSRKRKRSSCSDSSSSPSDHSRNSQLSPRTFNPSSDIHGEQGESMRRSCSLSDVSNTTSDAEDDASSTDRNCSDTKNTQKYKRELKTLRKQIVRLTEIAKMNERGFYFISTTDAKCLYYTGITNFQTVRRIFEYLEVNMTKPFCNFSKEQVFVMTLTKLRLNPQFQILAYEYNVSLNTISKYFHRTLDIIDRCLSYVLEPPTKDVLLKHTPKSFKDQFGDARVFIVDCFEVRSETPEEPKAALAHFSNYKKAEATKFLIAKCPDGNICFISPGYGGRCSDKKIFRESGFVDILQPGDVVLADKGFDVDDLVRRRGAKLNIPTFLKQKQQFKPAEIEKNKQITRLRIHIERCIGVLKMKFLVMAQLITIDSLVRFENNKNIVDLAARVCCILYNFNPSIIPE